MSSTRCRGHSMQRSEITIDLGAIRHNAGRLLEVLDGAELWAVVKANGYGHGAADVARAALEAGASVLCVATVEEGVELRRAQRDARILVMGPTEEWRRRATRGSRSPCSAAARSPATSPST